MQLLTSIIIIILTKINIYLTKNLIVNSHSEYMTIRNDTGISENYTLELIHPNDEYILDIDSNLIISSNNVFYYLSYNDTKWKYTIVYSRNVYSLYIENMETFLSVIDDILKERSVNLRIKNIIIGYDSDIDINEIKGFADKTNINIFIHRQKEEIRKKYTEYSDRNFCSTFIKIIYSGDVLADNFVIFIFVFIIIYLLFWSFVHHKARKNGKYLFIHSYILTLLIFYLFHSLLLLIISMKKKYEYFNEEIYSGWLYNFFNFFQFFIKLLPALFSTIQINILELREHYRIIRNSKVIHVLAANIFFIISLENDNQYLSELLNGFLYIIIIFSLLYMFLQFKSCLDERLIDAIIDEPDLVPTIKFKKKILFMHSFVIVIFLFLYFCIKFILSLSFDKYISIKLTLVLINYSDLFLVLMLCFVHFPKQLPPMYVDQIIFDPDPIVNNENDYFENIYSYERIDEEKYFENYKPNESSNIIIIENPFNDNKIQIGIEQEEEEEEEEKEEKEKEEKIKEKEKEKEKENDKADNGIETTEENSLDNDDADKNINSINRVTIDTSEKNDEESIKIENGIGSGNDNHDSKDQGGEEHHPLVVDEKEKDKEKDQEKLNESVFQEDILDLYHTKLGYIETD